MNEPIKGQAFTIEPFVLLGSGGQILAAPIVEKSDVTVAKDGGAAAQIATAPVVDANGVVTIALTAAEMDADTVDVNLVDDDGVWENVRVVIVTSTTTAAQDVRTELATELGRIDQPISSRLSTAGYSAPDNAGITAIQAITDLLEFVGGDIKATLDGEQVVASNMRGTDGANTVVPPTTGEISAAIVAAFPNNFSLLFINADGEVASVGGGTQPVFVLPAHSLAKKRQVGQTLNAYVGETVTFDLSPLDALNNPIDPTLLALTVYIEDCNGDVLETISDGGIVKTETSYSFTTTAVSNNEVAEHTWSCRVNETELVIGEGQYVVSHAAGA